MSRRWLVMTLAVSAALWCAAPLAVTRAAQAVAGGGAWGRAIEVPGLARLNAGRFAQVLSVSCASAGNCAAGGIYTDNSSHYQAFVVSERNGRWGKAIEVPGSATLNVGGEAQVNSVSCGAPGNCAAIGSYAGRQGVGLYLTFVVSERNGRWGKATGVPGLARLNDIQDTVTSVSCGTADSCTAGGGYAVGSSRGHAFVVSERNGRWGKAIEIPGLARLKARDIGVESLSCTSAGTCAVGGGYTDGTRPDQAFVVSERNGRWGKAIEVPGLARLSAGRNASIESVSCASAGNCAADGGYTESHSRNQAFVVSERDGRWGKAIKIPGLARLSVTGGVGLAPVSCGAAGDCAAGGGYTDGTRHSQAFVVSERDGRWGKAIEVPGSATLNATGGAVVESVSCGAAGNCAAGGFYSDSFTYAQAFVVSERNGRWGQAIEVPGSAALNAGGAAQVISVSCAPPGYCAAVGAYADSSGKSQGFVVSRS